MSTSTLRPVHQMAEAELIAEAEAIQRAQDEHALRDPATLMRHLNPAGYRHRAHLRIIAAAVADVGDGRDDRLIIATPPQVGKTVTAVVGGALWWLCRNPADRVLIGSYGSTLAINRGRSIRKLVVEHGHRYGLRLERGSARVDDWSLLSGGGVKSVGVGSGVTGSPGDFGLIDDPHKGRIEADQMRARDRVYEWYSGDFLSRLSPDAPIMIIMTRWHPDDLVSRVLADEGRKEDGGRWRVIHMPALATDPDRDPLRRPVGAPLPHPRISPSDTDRALRHWNGKRAASTVRDWHAVYQGDPRPVEGALLSRKLLRERRCYQAGAQQPCAEPVKAAVAVDPSGGGRDTAGIIGGYLGTDKRLYLVADRSGVMSSDAWARTACQMAVDIDADRVIVERNYGGDMAKLSIRTAWDALRREELHQLGGDPTADRYLSAARYARLCPRIVEVTAKKSKLLRAEPIAQQWTEDRIRTAAYLPDVEEEWATWQPDQTDSPGRIDASVYLGYGMLPPPSSAGGRGGAAPSGPMPTSGSSPLGRHGGGSSLGPLGGR